MIHDASEYRVVPWVCRGFRSSKRLTEKQIAEREWVKQEFGRLNQRGVAA